MNEHSAQDRAEAIMEIKKLSDQLKWVTDPRKQLIITTKMAQVSRKLE